MNQETASRWQKEIYVVFGSVCFFLLFLANPKIPLAAIPGDANNDGKTSQADVTAIINHILGIQAAPRNADCNNDGQVNIQDVICVINVINSFPPDPGDVAPPLDMTVATTIAAATEFIYKGSNSIQTGVAPGTIELHRVGVLRGKVLDMEGNPLSVL